MPDRAPTARDLARITVSASILRAARARLTEEGPVQLSLRAVARDVGMVSSAVYRYFPSRDDLLTALLVECYGELGAAVEDAESAVAAVDPDDLGGRWLAACRAIRRWALDHPGDYALVFGSPVPGYVAPPDTIEPAVRATLVLVRIVIDGASRRSAPSDPAGRLGSPDHEPPGRRVAGPGDASHPDDASRPDDARSSGDPALERVVASALAFVRERGLPDPGAAELVVRTLMAWTTVYGTISFELWGHLVGSVDDHDTYFDAVVARLGDGLGLPAPLA